MLKSMDWFTVVLYAVLIFMGWISICGASYDFENTDFFNTSTRQGMQLVWIATSTIIIFVIMMLDKHFFETFAYPIYAFFILLLIITIIFAPDIKGSRSWLVISGIRLQPAEFAKFATALALARIMNSYEFKLLTVKNFSIAVLIIVLPMICIITQKEAGSALVFLVFALVLYREGMSGYVILSTISIAIFFIISLKFENDFWNITPVGEMMIANIVILIICFMMRFVFSDKIISYYFISIAVIASVVAYVISLYVELNLIWISVGLVVLFSLFLIVYSLKKLVLKYAILAMYALFSMVFIFSVDYVFNDIMEPHQQARIKVSLGLEGDTRGAGYNVNQSKIAIGSGGLFGKGFLNGTQTKLKYVPEQDTDFIFCTIGEEFGFAGSFFVLLVYFIFLLRLIVLAERQPTIFGRVYGYSVMSIFLFHIFVNIGMVCGILPVIGIPLPFFSYGGSSLWGFTILLFIFLRFDIARKERE
jgi:rod shape determining protein RodA